MKKHILTAIDKKTAIRMIHEALLEDKAHQDITTRLLVDPVHVGKAFVVAGQTGILAGLPLIRPVFQTLDPKVKVRLCKKDGDVVKKNEIIAELSGRAGALLSAERVCLNLLSHLSGIATLTYAFAQELKGTRAILVDTRKTHLLFRRLEKYAVRCGGGFNHRLDLSDAVMIKDNHLAWIGGSFENIGKRLKKKGSKQCWIEVDRLAQIAEVLPLKPDCILLDNFSPLEAKKAVALIRKQKQKILTEVSGCVSLSNIRKYAQSGCDRIAVGAITHSAPSLDLKLEYQHS